MSIGKRIAEERKNIGLSQSAFAELMGVSFSSQRRYEDGRSDPDTGYLDSLRKHGVDVDYILTGDSYSDREAMNIHRAFMFVINRMAERIGCQKDAVANLFHAIDGNKDVFQCGELPPVEVVDAMFDGCDLEINGSLLSAILQGVDAVGRREKMRLSPEKKAMASVVLYRSFKASGKVDQAMIEETVKLASG